MDSWLKKRFVWFVSSCAAYKKSQPYKQHIWFLPTQKLTLKKPKELFFANARLKMTKRKIEYA